MKNPGARLRWLPARTPPILRLVAYSSALVGLLSYLSFRGIYSHPKQVELRLRERLAAILADGAQVEVTGAAYRYGQGTRVESVDIDSPWVSSDGLPVVRMRGLHLDARVVECSEDGNGTRFVRRRPSTGGGRRLVVCAASINLEHEGVVSQDDEPIAGWQGWNFHRLLGPGPLEAALASEPFDLEIRRLDLGWWLARQNVDTPPLRIEARDVRVSGSLTRLSVTAALTACGWWDTGSVVIVGPVAGRWRVTGELLNFRAGRDWLALLPAGHAELWRSIDPQGSSTLELRELSLGPTDGAAVGDSSEVLDLLWRHHDTTMRLPVVDVAMSAVRGVWHVTEDGVAWGADAAQPPTRCEVWGQPCRLSGRLGTDGQGKLRVEIVNGAISTLQGVVTGSALAWLVRAARASGSIEGSWTLRYGNDASPLWTSALTLAHITFASLRALSCETVEIESAGTRVRDAEDGTSGGEGRLWITGLDWDGIGRFGGGVDIGWDGSRLRFDLDDVTLTAAAAKEKTAATRGTSGEAVSPAVPRKTDTRPGRVDGWLERTRDGGHWRVDLRWTEVPLVTKILRAAAVSGEFRTTPQRPAGALSAIGTGTLRLGRGTVPAGVVAPASWEFERGECEWEWEWEEGGIRIRRLELFAREADASDSGLPPEQENGETGVEEPGAVDALRAEGTIGFDGAVDIVCKPVFRAGRQRSTTPMPETSPPGEQVRNDDRRDDDAAAAQGLRAGRITGFLGAPDSRRSRPGDPAFRGARATLRGR